MQFPTTIVKLLADITDLSSYVPKPTSSLMCSGFLCLFAVASVVLSVVFLATDGCRHTVVVLQLLLLLMLTAEDIC